MDVSEWLCNEYMAMSILYAHRVKKYEKKNHKIFKKCYKTAFLQSFRGRKGLIRRRIKRSTSLKTQKTNCDGKKSKTKIWVFFDRF